MSRTVLADTNIIIYSRQSRHGSLRKALARKRLAVNWIIKTEVLGWGRLDPSDEALFRRFFSQAIDLPIDEPVIEKTIEIRKKYGLNTADAVIAATALEYEVELWTANTSDFAPVAGLKIHNPLEC